MEKRELLVVKTNFSQVTGWCHSWFGVPDVVQRLNLNNINCISWIQFRSWLSPDGVNVFNFLIQKVSCVFNLSFSISLDVLLMSCNCSIMMNLASRLKLCPVWLKCLFRGMAVGSLTSFLWLFNHILKALSAFQTYWMLQSLHFSKCMMKLLLQVVFWNILNVLLVWLLFKCLVVFITCLQQSVIDTKAYRKTV